jgi:tetratricopeptide (TPR) repeat protein
MRRFVWLVACAGLAWVPAAAQAQGAGGADAELGRPEAETGDAAARRLLKRAQELLQAGEKDRGVKMLENLIEQHPDSFVRYLAYLDLGKHYLEQYQQPQAISYLRRMKELERGEEELKGETADLYLEAMYLTGVAYFQLRQYANAFPILRTITNNYPNTVWANQSYYYVGMCHFAQGNWKQAIRDLSLVGTFVDPRSPALEYIEAGRRFYVKVEDGDLPVLQRLGRDVKVDLVSGKGDKETLACIPLSGKKGLFIASIATEIAAPQPDNGLLEIEGGDTVLVKYYDDNTKEGRKDVLREKKVKAVSTGTVAFTTGTYESAASAAFQKQPLFVLLADADLDTSDAADAAQVRIVSRYREETGAGEPGADLERAGEEPTYKIRDEVTLTLKERGEGKTIHSGRFGGSVAVDTYREAQPVDKNDATLVSAIGDEVVATYVDSLHIGGESPRESKAAIRVAGEIDRTPQPQQNVVPDPILLARKNLVEATAFLELARIFKSMGLLDGAKEKANEGLDRVNPVIGIESPIPSSLKEEAFRLKWNLYIVQEDYKNAIVTCQLFNRLYPDSPFVDQALLGIGQIRFENKDYDQARGVFEQILRLERSLAKGEAQYMIAQCLEAKARAAATAAGTAGSQFVIPETAIQQYKLCADRYPDSPFAGESLAKLVQYYIDTRDYAQASDLLDRVFEEYPDADFLDTMLLQWVLVAYNMSDLPKAFEKCSQLVTEYPNSKHAPRAHELLDRIKKAMERTTAPKEGEAGPAGASAESATK